MASPTFSLERASDEIRGSGFYYELDQRLGILLEAEPKSCLSAEGLEFCKLHVLRDEVCFP
jgi:hypothetical protein